MKFELMKHLDELRVGGVLTYEQWEKLDSLIKESEAQVMKEQTYLGASSSFPKKT